MKSFIALLVLAAIGGCAADPTPEAVARMGPQRKDVEPFPGVTPSPTCPDIREAAISTPGPEYPRGLIRIRQAGWVIVQFDVLPDGLTTNFKVVASSPPGVFDAAALDAVYKWKYQPNNPRVNCRMDAKFTLPD